MLKIFDKISSRSLPRVLPTVIVCGDCSGDGLLPIRTNLTSDGLCAECGGRSYEFASVIGAALAQHLQNTKEINYEPRNQNTNGSTEKNTRHPAKKFRVVGR